MILNAKLTQVTQPPTSDGKGGETPGATTAVDVECCLSEVLRSLRISLGDRIAGATAMALIPLPTPGVAEFKRRMRLTFTQDGVALPLVEVVEVKAFVHDAGESHWQVFLKGP